MDNSKLTIVVIDDSPTVHKLFECSAQALLIDLVSFSSAHEAEEFLKNNKPALLFLDNIMPDKNGLSFLQELRQMPLHTDTKTIIISTKDYQQDRKIAKGLGALDFIIKPMPIQKITSIIEDYTKSG